MCAQIAARELQRLLAELAPGPLAERLNVGLCGLQSEDIDWAWLGVPATLGLTAGASAPALGPGRF